MILDLAPYIGLIVALGGCVALAARNGRLQRELGQARAMRDTAQGAEQTATRLLRLASHEMRGIGMTLHGHADRLSCPDEAVNAPAHAIGLAAASAQILGLADELQDHTLPDLGLQSLREELVDPIEAMRTAVEATTLALEPGRRHWHVTASRDLYLWADRRALRHVLGRVLGDAARNTRQDDSIDLSVHEHPEGICLQIEDEGMGLARPEPGAVNPRDSRGIGLRLALARALMMAHGGRLEVEAATQVGTQVRLIFPAARVRDAQGQPRRVTVTAQ